MLKNNCSTNISPKSFPRIKYPFPTHSIFILNPSVCYMKNCNYGWVIYIRLKTSLFFHLQRNETDRKKIDLASGSQVCITPLQSMWDRKATAQLWVSWGISASLSTSTTMVTRLLIHGLKNCQIMFCSYWGKVFVHMPTQMCLGNYLFNSHKASWLYSTFCRECCRKKKSKQFLKMLLAKFDMNYRRFSPHFRNVAEIRELYNVCSEIFPLY